MAQIYIKSRKWGRDDLEGRSVEFRIVYADATRVGVGFFRVHGNGVERLAIDIVVEHSAEYFDRLYHLIDSLAESIEVHPDQGVAQYRLCGRFDPHTS